MFKFRLTQEFRKRADDMVPPYPRGAVTPVSTAGSMLDNSRFGAYAALGAIVLGGVMMIANIQRNRCDVPVAVLPAIAPVETVAVPNAAPSVEPAITAAQLPPPTPRVVAAAPAAPASTAPAKMTARIDTSSTGSIAKEKPAKRKHKAHRKKPKPLDNPG